MHAGKELEAHWVEKGRLSCDSDAPQVGSARSDSASVVKVNRKTNRRKTRPYCTFLECFGAARNWTKETQTTFMEIILFCLLLNKPHLNRLTQHNEDKYHEFI